RVEGALRIADADLGGALDAFGVTLPAGVNFGALGGIGLSGAFRAALTLADPVGARVTDASAVSVGPYRLAAADISELSVDVLGAVLRGAAELGNDGILRGTLSTTPIPPEPLGRALGGLMPDAIAPQELGALAI